MRRFVREKLLTFHHGWNAQAAVRGRFNLVELKLTDTMKSEISKKFEIYNLTLQNIKLRL